MEPVLPIHVPPRHPLECRQGPVGIHRYPERADGVPDADCPDGDVHVEGVAVSLCFHVFSEGKVAGDGVGVGGFVRGVNLVESRVVGVGWLGDEEPDVVDQPGEGAGGVCAAGEADGEEFVAGGVVRADPEVGGFDLVFDAVAEEAAWLLSRQFTITPVSSWGCVTGEVVKFTLRPQPGKILRHLFDLFTIGAVDDGVFGDGGGEAVDVGCEVVVVGGGLPGAVAAEDEAGEGVAGGGIAVVLVGGEGVDRDGGGRG